MLSVQPGQQVRVQVPDGDEAKAAAMHAQPIRFLGQYHDSETHLHYNRFRYYDADCGRYVSIDPIGLSGGMNSYQYAPNPTGWTDPLGLSKAGGAVNCHCNASNGSPIKLSFPADPHDFTKMLGIQPKKIGITPDGTLRMVWEPNADTRIRFESHPEGLRPGDVGFNPRHHGEHYHIELKPNGISWNNASKNGLVTKPEPVGYTPGSGKGFLPGEEFPGYN